MEGAEVQSKTREQQEWLRMSTKEHGKEMMKTESSLSTGPAWLRLCSVSSSWFCPVIVSSTGLGVTGAELPASPGLGACGMGRKKAVSLRRLL